MPEAPCVNLNFIRYTIATSLSILVISLRPDDNLFRQQRPLLIFRRF